MWRQLILVVAVFSLIGLPGCNKSKEAELEDVEVVEVEAAPEPDESEDFRYGGMTLQEAVDKGLGETPTNENPELVKFLKQKKWPLKRDFAEGKPYIFLSVGDPSDGASEAIVLTPDDYRMIAKSKTVNLIYLNRVEASEEGLGLLAGIPKLEGIVIRGGSNELAPPMPEPEAPALKPLGATDRGLKALAKSQTLKRVELIETEAVTDEGIKALAQLPQLERLYLYRSGITGTAFEAYAGKKSLRALLLEDLTGPFTDAGARAIAKIPNLVELTLTTASDNGEATLTTGGIRAIVDTRLPPRFEFDNDLVDNPLFIDLVDKGWLWRRAFPGRSANEKITAEDVQTLALGGMNISDEGFQRISACKNLETLFLDKTKISGDGLVAVSKLPLKELHIWNSDLTESHFRTIGQMTGLGILDLHESRFDPQWLKHLEPLKNLTQLNLNQTPVDESAVSTLMTFRKLESLHLYGTKLTNEGFCQLLELPELSSFNVHQTQVTKTALESAQKEHPKIYFQ